MKLCQYINYFILIVDKLGDSMHSFSFMSPSPCRNAFGPSPSPQLSQSLNASSLNASWQFYNFLGGGTEMENIYPTSMRNPVSDSCCLILSSITQFTKFDIAHCYGQLCMCNMTLHLKFSVSVGINLTMQSVLFFAIKIID